MKVLDVTMAVDCAKTKVRVEFTLEELKSLKGLTEAYVEDISLIGMKFTYQQIKKMVDKAEEIRSLYFEAEAKDDAERTGKKI